MNNLRKMIYGLAIGDACGIPYKSLKRDTFVCEKMTNCDNSPLFKEDTGTWSDDTSLTLCMMDALCEKSAEGIKERYKQNCINWMYNGAFTASGVSFDISSTNKKMVEAFEENTQNEFAKKERSNSNNGLTKISPIAFLNLESDEHKMAFIYLFNNQSNNHYVSNIGCLIYIKILENLLKYKDIKKAVQELIVDNNYRCKEYECLFNFSVFDYTRKNVRSTNYVVDSLISAIWAVYNSTSFSEAIFNAINLGGDTDAIGSITGSFAGIIYDIPLGFIYNLNGKTVIDKTVTKYEQFLNI